MGYYMEELTWRELAHIDKESRDMDSEKAN